MECSDKSRFLDLKKRVVINYVLHKEDHPRNFTAVQGLLLHYQPSYNSNRQYQSNLISNQLMLMHRGKTGYDEDETKYKKKKP